MHLIIFVSTLLLLPSVLTSISQTERKHLLTYHNDMRRKVASGLVVNAFGEVQPGAGDMRELHWDTALAKSAQLVADKCIYAHSKGPYGENIAKVWWEKDAPVIREDTVDYMAKLWFDEIEDNNGVNRGRLGNVSTVCKFGHEAEAKDQIGHYTQMVWSKHSRLGCGKAHCEDTKTESTLMFCHYSDENGKPGNWLGRPIYNPGKPCEFCADNCNDGLCTTETIVLVGGCKGKAVKCVRKQLSEGSATVVSQTGCSVIDVIPLSLVEWLGGAEAEKYRQWENKERTVTITYTVDDGRLTKYLVERVGA